MAAISSCILTTYATNVDGYGRRKINNKGVLDHRYVYVCHHKLTWKDIEGKVVRHLCNNPSCINLKHLALGTQKDNMQDMMRAGNRKGGGKPPVILSQEQTQQVRTERGTQREIAKKYGVSETVIWKIINNKHPYNDL